MGSTEESREASADNTEQCHPVNPTASVRHDHGFYLRGSDDTTYRFVQHLEQELERWKRRTLCLEHLNANDQELESFTDFPTYGAFKSFLALWSRLPLVWYIGEIHVVVLQSQPKSCNPGLCLSRRNF